MPTSQSRASYPDCETFLNSALSDPVGARMPFPPGRPPLKPAGPARQFFTRLHTFRTICRHDNAKIYPDPDAPLHMRSEYDPLQITLQGPDANGEYWIYAQRYDVDIAGVIESLSELENGGIIEGEFAEATLIEDKSETH